MSDDGTSPQPALPSKPKPVRYYKQLFLRGNSAQWRALMGQIREDYQVAYRAALAVAELQPEVATIRTLWKSAIETAQPGIKIYVGKGVEEDMGIRRLRHARYADSEDF